MQKNPKQLSHYAYLKDKWSKKHKTLQKKVWENHKIELSSLLNHPKQHILGGIMLAATPFISTVPSALAQTASIEQHAPQVIHMSNEQLSTALRQQLPTDVRPLSPDEETSIAATLSAQFNIRVSPELEGIRLNRTYGLIGKEQHLRRYPGDTADQHAEPGDDMNTDISDGTAPGLGAWGYFAPSKEQLTYEGKMRERWYIAVPTFLAPGFNESVGKYGLFFKYRKMLVVNPDNGKAVVTDIADAGPAPWTGKHLGGSPEVMNYLQRVDGAQRGPVLYFFIDDPNDTIPLGPKT